MQWNEIQHKVRGWFTFRVLSVLLCMGMVPSVFAEQAKATGALFSSAAQMSAADVRKMLTEFIAANNNNHSSSQHFCFLKNESGEASWVHWREGRRIILWDYPVDPKTHPSLDRSRRVLNLDKDIVANESDLHGSTYLATQRWADALIADCDMRGEHFVIDNPR